MLTFKKIGGQWRNFIAVDEDTLKETSFTKVKILIASKSQSKIEEEINMDANGRIHLVRVFEESSSRILQSIPSHNYNI